MKKYLSALLGLFLLAAGAAQAQQVYVPLATPRNLLDNGAFAVQQEGTGTKTCATTSAPAVTAIVADRWVCDTNVTSGTGQAAAITTGLPTGATGGVKIWRNSGSLAQPVALLQEIATANATQAAGKAVVLSFSAEALAGLKADNGSVITATIIYGTGTDETFSVGWTASPAITPAWTGVTVLQTNTFTITTSWAGYQTPVINVPSTATEIGVVFSFTPTTTGSGGSTDGFAVTQAQLEVGASPSPFEIHPYAYDLNVAYRYLYKISEGAAFTARAPCEIDTTSIALCYLQFPQTMLKAPTMSYTAGFSALNVATAVACTGLSTAAVPTGNASTPLGVMMNCASSAGFSAASTAAIFGDNAGSGVITAWVNM